MPHRSNVVPGTIDVTEAQFQAAQIAGLSRAEKLVGTLALANRMGVKAPTMTRTIGRMEAQGFLERRSDGTDGRLTKVHLTETGLKSVEQIGRAVAECGELAVKGLSDKEVRTLLKLLKAVEHNLQSDEGDRD